MNEMFERLIVRLWNRATRRPDSTPNERALDLGSRVVEEQAVRDRVAIPHSRRAEHIAVLGKTGTGKSSLLRYLASQDIEAGRGFIYFDLHGDATSFLLAAIAAREAACDTDLCERVIVVEPSDPDFSVGLNPLAHSSTNNTFVQMGEFAQVLRHRWQLDSFGARTDELLRNSLYAIFENGLTLLEVAPFLTNTPFRAECLKRVKNAEVREYFQQRFDQASEPMRAVMREPILNKISTFTADPHFRHIVGQQVSTFSVANVLQAGQWVILNLHKGRLGEHALTLGSLFLSQIKNALFARKNRQLFTLYCDEIQNLVALDCGLETILSEARKFGVSVLSANQYLEQYPNEMRSAVLAVGTHIFFQLSSPDAHSISNVLDGGKTLAEQLKNLPRRHMIVKTGNERWKEARVPTLKESRADYSNLYERCRNRWARRRQEIEKEIVQRHVEANRSSEVLDAWE